MTEPNYTRLPLVDPRRRPREFRVVEGADPEFLPFLLGLSEQEIDTVKAHFAA